MSNETMTDEQVRHWIDACNHETARQVLRDFIRLRGEAATEGQAVAYQTRIPTGEWSEASWETYERVSHNRPADARQLYTRTQPAAPAPVAGDAVAEYRAKEVEAMRLADADGRYLNAQGHQQAINAIDFCVAALAQDRASQAGAAVPEGITPVYMICNAYESGFGKGQQGARRESPYDKADHKEAWLTGYDEGAKRAAPTPAAERIPQVEVLKEPYNDDEAYGLKFIIKRKEAILQLTANPSEYYVVERVFDGLLALISKEN